jgi:hypothetical protein
MQLIVRSPSMTGATSTLDSGMGMGLDSGMGMGWAYPDR